MKERSGGTGWARIMLVLGAAASLSGNIGATALHSPPGGAYIAAALWPILLFGSIELIIRTRWGSDRVSLILRVLAGVLVGGMAGYVSYQHGVELLDSYEYDWAGAHLGPIAVDAVLAIATAALARIGHEREESERAPSERAAERSLAEWVASAPHERSAAERASDHQAIASTEPAIASTELDERARIERAIAELPDDASNRAIADRAEVEWCDRSRFAIARARKRRAEQIGEGA